MYVPSYLANNVYESAIKLNFIHYLKNNHVLINHHYKIIINYCNDVMRRSHDEGLVSKEYIHNNINKFYYKA